MYDDFYFNHFRNFLEERLAISPDRLAKELDYNRTNLQKIIVGLRNIPKNRRGEFIRIMEKYGYKIVDS